MSIRTPKSITAQNTFTDAVTLKAGETADISISGTFTATVTVQRKIDGTNWRDVGTYTSSEETVYTAGGDHEMRVGVKTGDFTSGTVNVLINGGV